VVPVSSSNWSGYVATGGPFAGVTGTFNVPSLYQGDPTDSALGVWVGIDGWDNSNLIQAGIAENPDPSDPTSYYLYAWWEILPALATPVSLSVSTGDEVTVTIVEGTGSSWIITIKDDTTGKIFTTDQQYSGPATSAEWIVEAPTIDNNVQSALAPFGPSVSFSGLGYGGTADGIYELTMVDQYGNVQATPSGLGATGFSVGYGSGNESAERYLTGRPAATASPPPARFGPLSR
jgi:hypothetical protein